MLAFSEAVYIFNNLLLSYDYFINSFYRTEGLDIIESNSFLKFQSIDEFRDFSKSLIS